MPALRRGHVGNTRPSQPTELVPPYVFLAAPKSSHAAGDTLAVEGARLTRRS